MSIRANVDARRLDQRGTWQRNQPTRSATGDEQDNWVDLGDSWIAVDGAKAFGAEPAVGGSTLSRSDYTVWVRADVVTRHCLTPADRLLWKGTILNIKDVPNQQLRGRMMAVICNAGMNGG